MRKIVYSLMLLVAVSCVKEFDNGMTGDTCQSDVLDRPLVEIEFTPGTDVTKSVTSDTGNDAWLSVRWDPAVEEKMGVYIRKSDGSDGIYYAGEISSPASESEVRSFSGSVLAKQAGEKYIYLHPSLHDKEYKESGVGEVVTGHPAQGTIDFSPQSGLVGDLKDLMPLLWEENSTGEVDFKKPVYMMKFTMKFPSNPGELESGRIETMNRGTSDNVFPTVFSSAVMGPGDTRTNSITFTNFTGSGTERVAYAVSSSYDNVDVFSSKFRLVAQASGGTYYSEYKSFPGQDGDQAQETHSLKAFENGKVYRASRQMSTVHPATSISDTYHVYSLLGLWDQYGKPFDPDSRIISAADLENSNAPARLKEIVGTPDLQNEFSNKINLDRGTSGTPNFLGRLYYSPGNATDAGKTIKLTKASKVFVTFVSENAWDRNLLGYYYFPHNGSSDDSSSQPTTENFNKYILFPDVSRPDHVPFNLGAATNGGSPPNVGAASDAPLQPYSTVQLIYTDPATGMSSETFPENTFVGFFVMKNAMYNVTSTMLNWGAPRLFTNYGLSTLNPTVNPFAAGDLVKTDASTYASGSSDKLKDLAVFGFRDNASDGAYTAFATMIFLVSTEAESGDDALSMQNTAALNLSATTSTNLVVGRTASYTVTQNLSVGITSTNDRTSLDGTEVKYTNTLTIRDPLYGGFKTLEVTHDGSPVSVPSSDNPRTRTITVNAVNGDIVIDATTNKIVKVKALKYSDMTNLANGDQIILHCTNSWYTSDGAFYYDSGDAKQTLPFAQSPFWAADRQIVDGSDDGIEVDPMGKYTDCFWTVDMSGGSLKLKNARGKYLVRSNDTYPSTSWPLVKVDGSGTAFTAEDAGNGGYDMYIKAPDMTGGFNYLTCRVGKSDATPIFFSFSAHVNNFGKWRAYKIWTED